MEKRAHKISSTPFSFKERRNSVVQKLSTLPAVVKRGLFDPVTHKARQKQPLALLTLVIACLSLYDIAIKNIFQPVSLSLVLHLHIFPKILHTAWKWMSQNKGGRGAGGCKIIRSVETVAKGDIWGKKYINIYTLVKSTLNLQLLFWWCSNKHESWDCSKVCKMGAIYMRKRTITYTVSAVTVDQCLWY